MIVTSAKKVFVRSLIILLVVFLPNLNSFGQNKPVKFTRLTTRDGLSQNRIHDITQDHEGFIWIGTEDGLNRYDGYNFEIFKRIPGDSLSLADNLAKRLYISRGGTLWIGSGLGGLSKYNSETKTFKSFQHNHTDPTSISDNSVNSISEDEKANLWISTNNGFDYLQVKEENFIHMINMLPQGYDIHEDQINFIYQDKKEHLWIGTEDRIHYFKVSYYDNGMPQLLPVKIENQLFNSGASCIEEDRDGNIWVGTFGDGLFLFDSENKSLTKIQPANDNIQLDKLFILTLETDDAGNIWIGGFSNEELQLASSYGLLKLNVKSRQIENYINDPEKTNSLSENNILSLFMDKTGVLFVGTDLSGLNIYDKSIIKFSLFTPDHNHINGFRNNAVRGMYLDPNNDLWIASDRSGLVSYDRTSGRYEFFTHNEDNPASISHDGIRSIHDDGEYLWIGTLEGLNRFDKKKKNFKTFYLDSSDHASNRNAVNYNILELDNFPGILWFGSNGGGLVKFDKINSTFKNYIYDPEDENSLNNRNNFVRTVWYSSTRPDELWVGTTNGINILNLNTETFRYYMYDPEDSTSLSHPNVMHFYEDKKGYVWIATYGGGINRFDPKTETFLRFTESNSGLPNNGTYGILPDEEGNLWISTNNGITKFNPGTFEFRNYSVDDGLQSEEFNGGSYFRSSSGEMFFGGINGYNSFFPSEVMDNKFIPEIVITDLKIFNESVPVSESSPLKKQISKSDEIILAHWQNDISFEYVALHYSNPSKNKYAFKLENYEDEWRYVDYIRIATYTNLDPGEYVFKVKGTNNDGLWNEEGKSIRLIISPPWWKTTWAYLFYLLSLGLLIFLVDRIQRARLVSKEKRKAQIVLLEAENERKTKELEEARQLQLSMLPKELPQLPNLDIAVYMKTATEVGGDYYDFNIGIDGTLTVVLGDATGHGMKAGTMVTSVKSLFNSYSGNPDILFTFHEMTRCIKQMRFHMLTMCLTMLKIEGNNLKMSAAGMPPLFIYRKDDRTIEEHIMKGMPLGSIEKFPYDIRQTTLNSGDTIILMSDGFPELMDEKKELYGYKRVRNKFEEVAERDPEQIIDFMKNEGLSWMKNQEPDDDITFVVIKVK